MRKIFHPVCFVALFLTCPGLKIHAQPTNYSPEVKERIKQVENNLAGWTRVEGIPAWTLGERMKFYGVKGVSIAVIKDFHLVWSKGYGLADSAEQRPVNTSTLFQAGSISKSLNGIGVLKLVQEGKLDLFTDINQYLKTWKFPYDSVSKGKKITIANLLSHTAGLTVHGFPGYAIDDTIPSLIQVLDGVPPANTKAVRSMFEPSLKFKYSGGGTTISQLIVQDVTGLPYDDYMWKNVLQPMGMMNSSYTQPPKTEKQKFLGTGYYKSGEVKGKYHTYPEQAAAGLWTTSADIAKYVIETQLSLDGKSNKVLSHAMTKTMLTPYIDSNAGLGVFILDRGTEKYFSHNGQDEGFVAKYIGSMDGGNGAVVMANTDNQAILEEIVNSISIVYNWKDYYPRDFKKTVKVKDDILELYVGKYKFEDNGFIISIVKEKPGLFIFYGDTKMEVRFTSDTDFFVLEEKGEMKFIKDSNGNVNEFIFRDEKYETKGVRVKN